MEHEPIDQAQLPWKVEVLHHIAIALREGVFPILEIGWQIAAGLGMKHGTIDIHLIFVPWAQQLLEILQDERHIVIVFLGAILRYALRVGEIVVVEGLLDICHATVAKGIEKAYADQSVFANVDPSQSRQILNDVASVANEHVTKQEDKSGAPRVGYHFAGRRVWQHAVDNHLAVCVVFYVVEDDDV